MITIIWPRGNLSLRNRRRHLGLYPFILRNSIPSHPPSPLPYILSTTHSLISSSLVPILLTLDTLNSNSLTHISRVKDFRTDILSLRTKYDTLKKRHADSILHQNRNELFGRRPFVSQTPENPYTQIKTNSGITRQEGLLREDTFLRRTEGQLDEFIGRGMAVLDNLVEQKGFLKVFPCYSRRLYSRRGCIRGGCIRGEVVFEERLYSRRGCILGEVVVVVVVVFLVACLFRIVGSVCCCCLLHPFILDFGSPFPYFVAFARCLLAACCLLLPFSLVRLTTGCPKKSSRRRQHSRSK
jgi:hypothetical protein